MTNVVATRPLRVAYLGPPASFSEQAAGEAFPSSTPATHHPLPSFKHIFSAIQKSSAPSEDAFDFAVIPVENSTNGGVVQVLDLLIQCGLDPSSCLFPDVEVVAEHYLEVHHCLYIHPSAVPFRDVSNGTVKKMDIPISKLNITSLYTHPQVWGQCNNFLSEHFTSARTERIDMSSTSAAAAFVANHSPISLPPSDTSPAAPEIPAAICSSLAGVQNNLALVASNIEDEPGKNTTRFLVIRNCRLRPSLPQHLAQPMPSVDPLRPVYHKSLLTFTVPHTMPGSLASALAIFRKHDSNLTAITTRPSRERNWHYVFFVECQKQANKGEEGNPSILKALVKDLENVAERTCWLGTWVDRLKYK